MELNELTPVQFDQDIFWKRDDYFKPFGQYHVNGGKLRHSFQIFEEMKLDRYDGVITSTSVHSPQAPAIAKVAQYYGIPCMNCVGGTNENNFKNLPLIRLSQYYGSEIKIVAKHGMPAVIYKRTLELAEKHNYLPIEINKLQDPRLLFEGTAHQCANLPKDLDLLVVPTAAAVRLAGILIGLQIWDINVKRIVAVCVGPPREKQLANFQQMYYNEDKGLFRTENKNLNFRRVEWVSYYDQKIPYSKLFPFNVMGEPIDPLYEGKAVDWLLKHRSNEKTLLWCVGTSPNQSDVDMIIKGNL